LSADLEQRIARRAERRVLLRRRRRAARAAVAARRGGGLAVGWLLLLALARRLGARRVHGVVGERHALVPEGEADHRPERAALMARTAAVDVAPRWSPPRGGGGARGGGAAARSAEIPPRGGESRGDSRGS